MTVDIHCHCRQMAYNTKICWMHTANTQTHVERQRAWEPESAFCQLIKQHFITFSYFPSITIRMRFHYHLPCCLLHKRAAWCCFATWNSIMATIPCRISRHTHTLPAMPLVSLTPPPQPPSPLPPPPIISLTVVHLVMSVGEQTHPTKKPCLAKMLCSTWMRMKQQSWPWWKCRNFHIWYHYRVLF